MLTARTVFSNHKNNLSNYSNKTTYNRIEKKKFFFSAKNSALPYTKEATIAGEGYKRWWAAPGAFLVQLSIGSVYAWSIFNEPLIREIGVVASASSDWDLTSVVPIFSTAAVMFGITSYFFGPWVERNGASRAAAMAALFWGSGLLISSLACQMHSLPLLYLGYGIFGGVGWGFGYLAPVSTLIKWFPDRKGLATGLAVTAFGGGAMIAAPINEFIIKRNFQAPTYLGTSDAVSLVTLDGKRFAEMAGELKEVLVVSAQEIASFPGLHEGVYVVGTGDTGATATFFTLALIHITSMLIGSLIIKSPREGWLPEGYTPPQNSVEVASGSVHFKEASRTPQYYLFIASVIGFAIAGVSVISCAKTIMADVFGRSMPYIVTSAFAATYVAALSAANMSGRLGWAMFSDYIGRKNTYYLFGTGLPIALMIPYITTLVSQGQTSTPLLASFYVGTILIVSFYGGLFSVLPAYISDIFGKKYVGAIHGRILPAWSLSALIGPSLLSALRTQSYNKEIRLLADKVDPTIFEKEFKSSMGNLDQLIETKTVTITKLLEIAPPGTLDPTPLLYNTTIYCMCGIMLVAIFSNYKLKIVDSKHFEPTETTNKN